MSSIGTPNSRAADETVPQLVGRPLRSLQSSCNFVKASGSVQAPAHVGRWTKVNQSATSGEEIT